MLQKSSPFRGPATLCCQRSRKALCVHSRHMHRTQVYNVSAQEPMYTMSLLLCPLSFGTPVPKDHVHCSNSRQQSTKKQNNKFGRRVLKIQAVCNSDSEPKTALRWYSSTSSLARCYYRTYCHYWYNSTHLRSALALALWFSPVPLAAPATCPAQTSRDM